MAGAKREKNQEKKSYKNNVKKSKTKNQTLFPNRIGAITSSVSLLYYKYMRGNKVQNK